MGSLQQRKVETMSAMWNCYNHELLSRNGELDACIKLDMKETLLIAAESVVSHQRVHFCKLTTPRHRHKTNSRVRLRARKLIEHIPLYISEHGGNNNEKQQGQPWQVIILKIGVKNLKQNSLSLRFRQAGQGEAPDFTTWIR